MNHPQITLITQIFYSFFSICANPRNPRIAFKYLPQITLITQIFYLIFLICESLRNPRIIKYTRFKLLPLEVGYD